MNLLKFWSKRRRSSIAPSLSSRSEAAELPRLISVNPAAEDRALWKIKLKRSKTLPRGTEPVKRTKSAKSSLSRSFSSLWRRKSTTSPRHPRLDLEDIRARPLFPVFHPIPQDHIREPVSVVDRPGLSTTDVTNSVRLPTDDDWIGEGGFGSVYRSQMRGRGMVVLKRLQFVSEPAHFLRVSNFNFGIHHLGFIENFHFLAI